MEDKDYIVSKGGVRIQLSYNTYGSNPSVENIKIHTPQQSLVVSEGDDDYNDVTIPLDQFRQFVEGLNQILDNIDDSLNNAG